MHFFAADWVIYQNLVCIFHSLPVVAIFFWMSDWSDKIPCKIIIGVFSCHEIWNNWIFVESPLNSAKIQRMLQCSSLQIIPCAILFIRNFFIFKLVICFFSWQKKQILIFLYNFSSFSTLGSKKSLKPSPLAFLGKFYTTIQIFYLFFQSGRCSFLWSVSRLKIKWRKKHERVNKIWKRSRK